MNFLRTIWDEVKPILRHFVSAALISLLAIALRLLQMIVPIEYVDELKRIDRVLVIVLSWVFAVFTVLLILIRLSRKIYAASQETDQELIPTPALETANGKESDLKLTPPASVPPAQALSAAESEPTKAAAPAATVQPAVGQDEKLRS